VKFCTLLRNGEFGGCDAVDDDHRFGFTADRALCHTEGAHLPGDRIVAFGAVRGSMTDLYGPEPCGHPAGTPEAVPTPPAIHGNPGLTIERAVAGIEPYGLQDAPPERGCFWPMDDAEVTPPVPPAS
jgi:hypothetical protein